MKNKKECEFCYSTVDVKLYNNDQIQLCKYCANSHINAKDAPLLPLVKTMSSMFNELEKKLLREIKYEVQQLKE